jgi:hypothetical protein
LPYIIYGGHYLADGFGLARAPEDLMIALRKGIADGLQDVREEKNIPVSSIIFLPFDLLVRYHTFKNQLNTYFEYLDNTGHSRFESLVH